MTEEVIILEIGCGEKREYSDSLTLTLRKTPQVDVVADARALPFKDRSIDCLFSSHTIEYFSHIEVEDVVRERIRILKTGGIIEIRCPDLRARVLLFFINRWLEKLVREFDDSVVGVEGGIKNIGKGFWEESIALALDTFLGSADLVQDRLLKEKRVIRSNSGCNSIYRKKDIVAVGGPDEAVEHGKTGLLVPPRDPQVLADAIIQLLVDSDLRATMEENVKVKAEELSWDSIAKKHLMLYNSLLES
jgi:hypothetical protein